MPKSDIKTTTTTVVDTAAVRFPADKPAGVTVWSPSSNAAVSWKSNKPRAYFFIPGASCDEFPAPAKWGDILNAPGCSLEMYELILNYQAIIDAGYEICIVSTQSQVEQQAALSAKAKDKSADAKLLPFVFISDEKCELKSTLDQVAQLKMLATFTHSNKKQYFNRATLFASADGTVISVISFAAPTSDTVEQSKTNAKNHVTQAIAYAVAYPYKVAAPTAGPTSASTYLLMGDAKANSSNSVTATVVTAVALPSPQANTAPTLTK